MRLSSLLSILLVTPLLTAVAAPADSPHRKQSIEPNAGGTERAHTNPEVEATSARFSALISKAKPIVTRAKKCLAALQSNPIDYEMMTMKLAAQCLKDKCGPTMKSYNDAVETTGSSNLAKKTFLLEVMLPYVNCLEKFMDRSECHCPELLVPPALNGVDHSQTKVSAY